MEAVVENVMVINTIPTFKVNILINLAYKKE